MFSNIMVTVDLAHLETLEKSLAAAADLAKAHDATVCYVSVGPSYAIKNYNPHTLAADLEKFANEQAARYGIKTRSHAVLSVDRAAELDSDLIKAIDDTGSDLVVMGSHTPGLADYFFASNAAYVAAHANVSVFIVR